MPHILLLTLLSVVMILVAIAGAWPSFHKGGRDRMAKLEEIGDPLAVGVFLGAGLIHLLPDAAAGLDVGSSGYPWAFMLAGAMMLLLGWIEARASHPGTPGPGGWGSSTPIIATAATAAAAPFFMPMYPR